MLLLCMMYVVVFLGICACCILGLFLVEPSSSSRIGSHIGRDKLVSEPRPTIGAPLIDRVVWPLLSLEEKLFSESSYIGE